MRVGLPSQNYWSYDLSGDLFKVVFQTKKNDFIKDEWMIFIPGYIFIYKQLLVLDYMYFSIRKETSIY